MGGIPPRGRAGMPPHAESARPGNEGRRSGDLLARLGSHRLIVNRFHGNFDQILHRRQTLGRSLELRRHLLKQRAGCEHLRPTLDLITFGRLRVDDRYGYLGILLQILPGLQRKQIRKDHMLIVQQF